MTAVALLCTRVKSPTEEDWTKLVRLMKYRQGTEDMVLTLSATRVLHVKWFADTVFAVHPDMKSHTGCAMTMGCGCVVANSRKQKTNTTSSTESKLACGDTMLKPLMWAKLHIGALGCSPKIGMAQDNTSAIKLMRNGKASSVKKTHHIKIGCFNVKDHLNRMEFELEHCYTDNIWTDHMSKPLQGKKFVEHRDWIMGISEVVHQ